jgi:hypothetical protein
LEWPLFTALSSFSRDNYVFAWTTWTTLINVGTRPLSRSVQPARGILGLYKKGAFPLRIVRADDPVTRLASVPRLAGYP